MDWSFGVRYQVYNELKQTNIPWMPTLTLARRRRDARLL